MEKPSNAAIREAMAAHELFRRLGFTPDEIFLDPRQQNLMVVVKAQGLTFAMMTGETRLSEEETKAAWIKAASWWNEDETSEDDRSEIWRDSTARLHSTGIVGSMVAKGFRLPGMREINERLN